MNDPRSQEKPILLRFKTKSMAPLSANPGALSRVLILVERIREQAGDALSAADELGLARRLLLDERTPQSPEGLLRILGFVHLYTATGIHLYALANLTNGVAQGFSRVLRISPRVAIPWARAFAGGLWFLAWVLSGMRAGMVRPWVIVVLRTGARALGIRWRTYAPLALSLSLDGALCLWREDWAPGRMHYALAVAGGLMAMDALRASSDERKPHPLAEHLALSTGSWLLPAIWDAWATGLVALATPVLSLVTIPPFSLLLYPIGLGAAWLGADDVLKAISGTANSFVSLCSWPVLALPTLWVVTPAGLGMGALFATSMAALRGLRLRWLPWALLGLAAGFVRLCSSDHKPLHALQVEQLDVGQGDSALVRLSDGQAGLIDVGSPYALNESDWIQLLASRGIRSLAWIALTHLDQDHAGGLHRLARAIPIGCIVTSAAELTTERGHALSLQLTELGQRLEIWEQGCFPFPFFAPVAAGSRTRLKRNANMSGVVVPLSPEGRAFYANIGDADEKAEKRMLPWLRALVPPEAFLLFKLSHHGSRFSSSPEFLRALAPDSVWTSAGVGNLYHHPHPTVISRLHGSGIPVFRTDQLGELSTTDLHMIDSRGGL